MSYAKIFFMTMTPVFDRRNLSKFDRLFELYDFIVTLPASIFLTTLYYGQQQNAKRLEDGISIAIYTHYYTMFNHKKTKKKHFTT